MIATLLAHPELLQCPVLVSGERAFIGRPRSRIEDLVASYRPRDN